MKIYIHGEAEKYQNFFSAMAELPDVFDLQNHEMGEDTMVLIEKYDKILSEANRRIEHIPERFRIKV